MSLLLMGFILLMTVVVLLFVGAYLSGHREHRERMQKIKYGVGEVEKRPPLSTMN